MKSSKFALLFIVPALLLLACNPQREASDLLRQAQSLVDTQPDKALRLIDSIFYPERSLSTRQYMSYLVTRVRIHHQNSIPINDNTFIFTARDYFARRHNDRQQTALAFFYSGRVYHAQDNLERAIEHYRRATIYAAQINDIDLQGLIHFNMGNLFASTGLHLEALEEYKKAERLFASSLSDSAVERQLRCFVAIGTRYMLLGQKNNSFAVLYKGLELAKRSGNSELLRILSQNISVSYSKIGEYKNAEKHLRQAFALNRDATERPRYYLNFAHLFMNTGQTDSLNLYIDKLRQTVKLSDNLSFKVAIYNFLAKEAKARNDLKAAFEYLRKDLALVEQIHQRRLDHSVYEARRRFDYRWHQDAHTQALLRTQRISIIFLIFALTASLLVTLMYRRMLHQRDRMLSLQTVSDTLEKTVKSLQQNTQVAETKQTELSKVLEWKFELLRKSLLLKSDLKRFNITKHETIQTKLDNIVVGKYADSYHQAFAEITEILYPGLSAFIKQQFPTFTETEHNVAFFLLAGLRVKDIHAVLNRSENTINKVCTHIRQKMNLSERADFCTILKEMYQNSRKS